MHFKSSLASATLVLLAGLALIVAAGFLSHASAGRPANSGSVPPKVVTVEIHNFEFEPATVTIHPGDTVEWKNEDNAPHTATADTPKPGFDSGAIQSGAAWRYDGREKGTYNYICKIHPYMKGKLIVQ